MNALKVDQSNWKPAVKFYDKDSINYNNVICTSK